MIKTEFNQAKQRNKKIWRKTGTSSRFWCTTGQVEITDYFITWLTNKIWVTSLLSGAQSDVYD